MKFTGTCINQIWSLLVDHVARRGADLDSRDGPSKEVIGVSFELADIRRNFLTTPLRNLSPIYAAAELLWYLSGKNDDRLVAYASTYTRFLNDGKAFGGYGRRIADGDPGFLSQMPWVTSRLIGKRAHTQVAAIIQLLHDKPNTRQAVIGIWNGGDLLHAIAGGTNDLPCTLNIQFLVRDNRLHCVVNMRSNDLWLGTPYDVFAFTCIQRLIADALNLEYGSYHHNVGSLHYYERNSGKITSDIGNWEPAPVLEFDKVPAGQTSDYVDRAVQMEVANRAQTGPCAQMEPTIVNTLPGELAALAACQFCGESANVLVSNAVLKDRVALILLKKG